MQTFLPYSNFEKSAKVLDRSRLGKQRVEVLQILNTLQNGGGWSSHPAVLMWAGYEGALSLYGMTICDEWIERGYRDSCRNKILTLKAPDVILPPWVGDVAFHASHRSNLLRKDSEWYGQWGWTESENLPYVWPVQTT